MRVDDELAAFCEAERPRLVGPPSTRPCSAQVIELFADRSREQVVDLLLDVLAQTEDDQRPEGLVSITIAREHGVPDRFTEK